MSGKRSKELAELSRRAWSNMPKPIRATFTYRTVLEWTKRAYRALPWNQKRQWLDKYRRRLDGGFHPVSPKSLMPR